MFGIQENIGVSDCTVSFGSNNTWIGMYEAKFIDRELKLSAMMSLPDNKKIMTIEEIVRNIWERYIRLYI